ncbi:MAG: response regulator [Cyclobacteriaceae bacterium]
MKIMIVDDERDVEVLFRQKLRKEIRQNELELEFAFSGEEALEKLGASSPPEVLYVFSDINMPGMSGLEFLEQVKTRFPQVNVSMISAYGDAANYERAMGSGASGFFTKPIDFNSLKEEIKRLAE